MSKTLLIEEAQSITELERDHLEVNGFESDIKTNGTF